ncbi:MAG TPA: amino acid ABC transporter permease [Treponemataceae bacterium]|nr:MAG: amino acid ABC transporter permease [Treponema sp.]HOC29116.1 amino acid ABC transporter permease [Treponemataceae bacterium]
MNFNLDFFVRTFFLALAGLPVTGGLTACTLALAAPCALAFALVRMYRVRFFDKAVALYVSFLRGTPIVLQILIIYSILPSALNAVALRSGWKLDVFAVNPFWYALFVFTLNTSAILSEVFRSAILTVDRGQLEAALAAGLSHFHAWKRIVLPQAFLVALPNLSNATVNLIKSTSLAFMMTVRDVTAIAKIEASYGYNYIEAYLDIFIVYALLGFAVQWAFSAFERRLGSWRKKALFR